MRAKQSFNTLTFHERLNKIYDQAKQCANANDKTGYDHYFSVLIGICVALEYANIEGVWRPEVIAAMNELEVYWGMCNE